MMKISTLIKGSICVLGLAGAGSLFAAPANAGQASASGSAVVTRMDGSVISVSGELTLPSGMHYLGDAVVTPAYTGASATNDESIATLTIAPGTPTADTTTVNPVATSVAGAIDAAADLSAQSSLIRAAGGSTGFTALD